MEIIGHRKRIVFAVVAVGLIFLGIILIARVRDRGFEVRGDGREIVESLDVLPIDEDSGRSASPELAELFDAKDSMLKLEQFGCQVVVSSQVQQLIYGRGASCPVTVVNELPQYDLLIAYYDSICRHPPRLVVDEVIDQYRFAIDDKSNRGECDNIAVPNVIGIRFADSLTEAGGGQDSVGLPVVGTQPVVTVDVERLGWRLIEEYDCERQQEDGYRWEVELGSGPLRTASLMVVTRAEEDSLVADLYQVEEGEPLEKGWLTSARSPHFRVDTLPDRSLLVVEGVPSAAVDRRARGDSSELARLKVPCWGQRWDRRVTGEELSDVDVLYGDAALVRLVRDRAAGVGLMADARHSNIYRYTSGDEDVVLMDLRPRAVVMLTAYHEHPLPEPEKLIELVTG